MIATTLATETELSSVNSILGSIGQAPISKLYQNESNPTQKTLVYVNPEVALIHGILLEVSADVQNEGWVFNREENFPLTPTSTGEIFLPSNVLRMDMSQNQVYRNRDFTMRGDRLYDNVNHTFLFEPTRKIMFDMVWKWAFEELPSTFKRYITLRASGRAATQMVTNPQLVQLLATQEGQARASCLEYECNQGDHTFFGIPDNTAYQSFQPYRALMR
jgi:hypothetical protein